MLITELGRLTYDVVVEKVGAAGEKRVVNNRIAIKQSKTITTFLDIVAWNEAADIIGQYYKKGYEILIQGYLRNRNKLKKIGEGENPESIEYESTYLLVERVLFTYGNPKPDGSHKEGDQDFDPEFKTSGDFLE